MSIANGYITLTDYKRYHRGLDDTDLDDDAAIEDLIEAVSREIDVQSGRSFYGRTETRYYSVPSGRELRVDTDLLSVTTLTNGSGTVIAAGDYYLLPRNTSPKYAIVLKPTASVYWEFDSSGNSEYVISVLGSWGYYAEAPADIKKATREIVKSAYNRRTGENMDGIARVTAAGVVITPQDIPSSAAATIALYRKRT